MPFATFVRSFPFRLLAVLVVCAGLASSCQSSRSGFAFQLAPGRARVVAVAPPVAPPDSAPTTLPAATAPVAIRHASVLRRPRPQLLQPPKLFAASAAKTQVVGPAPTTTHRRAWLHRTHGTAESGFGLTIFGLLGLVTLAVGLIGLAISGGGLGWAIVAGVAALVVLVAYIDPDGR